MTRNQIKIQLFADDEYPESQTGADGLKRQLAEKRNRFYPMDFIKVRGARQHNLKDINVDIPRNQMVVITGLSGSGKSTLAFDTLYAEGQRRYVASLSTYARQFLERMDKPDVDLIEGLSPAIAIEQKTAGHNPRSTVGTVTEIYDYLRLLYARAGSVHCHKCGLPISSQSIDQMVDRLSIYEKGTRFIIMAPLVKKQKGRHTTLIKRLKRDGFARVRLDGRIVDIENLGSLPRAQKHTLDVVVDRLVQKDNLRNRLADSLELAISLSGGTVEIDLAAPDRKGSLPPLRFSEKAVCPTCGLGHPDLTPSSFSFNSPHGACTRCNGLGSSTVVDTGSLVPNPELSLREGAVSLWAHRNSVYFIEFLESFTHAFGTDIYTPFKELPDVFKQALFYGTDSTSREDRVKGSGKPFEGLVPLIMRRHRDTASRQTREDLQQYMAYRPCPACHGARLKPESLAVKINDRAIHELTSLSIGRALSFFRTLSLDDQKVLIAEKIAKEVKQRLEFLQDVGLDYLTLDRAAHTLSGGESQRIRLATQIGAKLTGVLYVLDEPSIGLHPRDNRKLRRTMMKMKELGNTLLVVEHDKETIMAADHVIDMGPGAGIKGGQVVFGGHPSALIGAEASLTGKYFRGELEIPLPDHRRPGSGKRLIITGAAHNNLKEIQATFPLGCLICVTGVSGSGKSSLIIETLFRALARHLYRSRTSAGRYAKIDGISHIDKVINIDPSPIGRTPRSNPGTYTGVFNLIRDLYSKTPDARARGYKSGRFSFNVKGGRCEACKGDGMIKIEMHFLPDIYVPCDICLGKRYNRETLEVRYKGKNIAEILDLTVNQAMTYFSRVAPIRDKLQTLIDVGLGYIHLGQQATTLSGGEAQRIKLARELSKHGTGRTLYILDEPTTGLHLHDINKLLYVLNRFVDNGNTVIVIEHHLDVIKTADHIIDLGPEGGDGGGYVVAAGTPEAISGQANSYTGQYLSTIL